MKLEQLKMLKLVAEHGTLRLASEAMFKTQPAISQGLKQLESQLGVPLFNRQGYRLELTEAGSQVYLRAQRLLNEASEIEQLTQYLAKGAETSLTLAFEASFDLSHLLPVLDMTQNEFPHTQIVLRQEYMSGALEALKQGQAQLAISPASAYLFESESVEGIKLYEGALVAVAAPRLVMRHPRLQSVEELRNEYQIVVQDSGQASKGKEMGVQLGQRRWYVNDFSTKKTLILSGMGWGKLPSYLIDKHLKNGTLCKLALEDYQNELLTYYYAMKLKNKLLGPVANRLWRYLTLPAQQSL